MAVNPGICAACGAICNTQEHHLVPRVHGGTKLPTVNLCHDCHGAVHGRQFSPHHADLTKAALAAVKARGVKQLGGYRGGPVPDPATARAAKARKAADFAADIGPRVVALRQAGMSLRQIGAQLTADGVKTPRGGDWTAAAVNAVLARAVA